MHEFLIPFYDIGFLFASVLFLMKYSLKRRISRELLERLFLPGSSMTFFKDLDRPIWIHAVSVGEVNSLKQFLDRLKEIFPEKKVVISVVTPTGKALADKLYKDKAHIFYLPLDLSFIIKKAVGLINPGIFLCLETEIWPNLYFFLNKRKIPILIFNARISDKSLKLYRLVRLFLLPTLKKVNFVAAQDRTALDRFLYLGVRNCSVRITGNMKFRSIKPSESRIKEFKDSKEVLVKNSNLLIVAGSTHGPEEEILLDVYSEIIKDPPGACLLLCPRHVERTPAVLKAIEGRGFLPLKLSSVSEVSKPEVNAKTVFILDTTGELIYYYSLADIVFVGGSMAKHGGHNILEPAYFSKPVIFGRFMFNFADIRSAFLNNKAGIEVKDKAELKEALISLIKDGNLRRQLGQRGRAIIDSSKDSIEENINIVKEFLPQDTRHKTQDTRPKARLL
ncbi:MAG: 3-deoxy-D-manno-octulosonic acid transferase [Candidatus Omnitrophica bacterium]|nr:3-deoxy-D-manno-octulosonic acid transferase [Candidatus Omnitrophota bacterium]